MKTSGDSRGPDSRRQPDGVDAEVRFHLDARTEELISQGLSRDEARRQALREFGNLEDARRYMTRLEERAVAAGRRRELVGQIRQDVVYAFRRIRSAPAFALTAVLTLALGIGANTAIFSVVYGVLLQPLPFPEPDRLYAVYSANRSSGLLRSKVSAVDLDDWRARRRAIEDLGGYWFADASSGVDLRGRGNPRWLSAVFVTPGFFSTLGVQPVAGRLPREDEMVRGGDDDVVMLGHGFWMGEFGGQPDVLGSMLTLGGVPHRVLGVLPPDLRFPADGIDVFMPFSTIPDEGIPRLRAVRVLDVVARASQGADEAAVRADMLAMTGQLAEEYPENSAWDAATVSPLSEIISGPVRQGLLVLFGAVGLVLLMTCVNVASLQLARAMGRGREIAVRMALGARRGRVVRQLLTESLMLAGLGGVIGMALAYLGLRGLLILSAGQLPRAAEISLNPVVLGFGVVLSVLTGLGFGLAPAWRASRGHAPVLLREGGRTATSQGQRLRMGLVVVEVAVAMMLIIGAGLMVRSFVALLRVDPGFRPEGLLAVEFTIDPGRHSLEPPAAEPGAGAPFISYYEQVIDSVRSLPGVTSAGAVKDAPFRGNGERNSFRLPGVPVPAGEDPPTATFIHVGDGYFATIGARVEGREFTRRDRRGSPLVVMINEAFARRHFPGERAVGKTLLFGRDVPIEIIGIAGDIRQVALAEPPGPTIYIHNLQNQRVKTTLVMRTTGAPLALTEAVRRTIWAIDPQQAITDVFTFDQSVSRALAQPRLLTVLLGMFGVLGLAIGAIGIYGLLASLVSDRRREIGVRLALGARPGDVLAMVVRRGLQLTLAGVVLGVAGAFALSRFVGTVLYGVEPVDPATFAGMAAVLLATAAGASWLPARRAAAFDPAVTLRAE